MGPIPWDCGTAAPAGAVSIADNHIVFSSDDSELWSRGDGKIIGDWKLEVGDINCNWCGRSWRELNRVFPPLAGATNIMSYCSVLSLSTRRIFGSWGERKALLVSISDTKLEEAGDVIPR